MNWEGKEDWNIKCYGYQFLKKSGDEIYKTFDADMVNKLMTLMATVSEIDHLADLISANSANIQFILVNDRSNKPLTLTFLITNPKNTK